jgi:hypothetical protein
MKVELITELLGYKYFKVKDEYQVFLLDGLWLCMCSVKHNRSIDTNCKHIEECKKYLLRSETKVIKKPTPDLYY